MSTPLMADLLRAAADEDPRREAYVHDDKRVDYRWLDRAADGFATTLLDWGVQPGDVVCLMLPDSMKFAACYFGAARAGAITSAINLRLGPAEQASIVARTEPVVTVVGDGAVVPDGVDAGRVLAVTDLRDVFAAGAPAHVPALASSDPVCLVWTSGTTGTPKGALYTHDAMATIARNVGDFVAPHDRLLHSMPFPHLGYLGWCYAFTQQRMTLVIAPKPWSVESTLELVEREHVTYMNGVPTQWSLIMKHPRVRDVDFSSLRIAAMGGAAASPALVREIRAVLGVPVLNGYSQTEAGIISGTRIGDPDEVVAGTVGRARDEVELRTVALDTGEPTPVGEIGEIVCRSPAMMREYWRAPELTATVIDADGWLHTGDLGRLDADGNLTIAGRCKEMYVRGGYNVYPTEVEAALTGHPWISRTAVVAVPDPVLGEIGVAYVVLAEDAPVAGDDVDAILGEVRAWCRARIADYKAPDRVAVVDELPLTAVGKLDKAALAARGASAASGDQDIRRAG
jgi:acyl-CoA synthetase (AMP-forming)/AMP-acid ligase II